jgi:DNA-binding FadR family transcriptional regulator
MREALRILEFRGLGRMRSGPHGGFVVELPRLDVLTTMIRGYLRMRRVTTEQLRSACACIARTYAEQSAVSRSADPWLKLHALAVHALEDMLRTESKGLQIAAPDADRQFPLNRSRVGQIVRAVVLELRKVNELLGHRVGSEADLCARFRVRRTTFREALRVLEDSNIVAVRRGRGQGIYACVPDPEPVMTQMRRYAAVHRVPAIVAWQTGQQLLAEGTRIAAQNHPTEVAQVLRRVERQLLRAPPRCLRELLSIDAIVLSCTANPVLELFAQANLTYALTALGDLDEPLEAPELLAQLAAISHKLIKAFLKRDAEQAVRQHKEASRLLATLWRQGAEAMTAAPIQNTPGGGKSVS